MNAKQAPVRAWWACTWARRSGMRKRSRHPAWRGRLPGRWLLPASTGTYRGLLPDHIRRSAGPELGSIQPAAGSRPCHLRPFVAQTKNTAVPTAIEQPQETRIIAGQWRWRWDLNPPSVAKTETKASQARSATKVMHRPRSAAVEVGFEPTEGLPLHTLSRRAPSATRRLHRRRAYRTPGGQPAGQRRRAKNSRSSAADSSASTPPITCARWLRRRSRGMFHSDPAAPAFGSAAP